MTGDEMRQMAEERRKLLAAQGINVNIRPRWQRHERSVLETAILARQGWIGRAADLNCSDDEVEEALAMIKALTERIESLA